MANDFFQEQLFNSDIGKSVGLSYFKKRSFPEHILKKFELGFSPANGDGLLQFAQSKGVQIDMLRQLGLVTQKDRDFFRSRVMFPIHNVTGKVIAFAGRSLTEDKRSPKYINSPETQIYNKSWVLYGLHLAKKAISSEDECILTEGYTDVISMHLQGVENVVASSGTSLTDGQAKLIKRYTKNVLILYDGDAAGIKAALRGVDIILSHDMNVRIALLPEGHDPDSFIKDSGVNGFKSFIAEEAQDFIMFKSGLLMAEAEEDPIKVANLIRDIVSSIARIPDALKRSLYVKKCAEKFDLREELLVDALNVALKSLNREISRKRPVQDQRSQASANLMKVSKSKGDEPNEVSDDVQERDVVRVLLKSGEFPFPSNKEITVADYLIANLSDVIDNFDNELYKRVIIEYSELLDDGKKVDASNFINHSDPKIAKLSVDLLSEKYIYSENWYGKHDILLHTQKDPDKNYELECQQGLLRLKFRKINKLIRENSESIEALKKGNEEDKLLNALMIHDRLVKQRNEVAKLMNQVVL